MEGGQTHARTRERGGEQGVSVGKLGEEGRGGGA